jgi:DNA/RNA endonuclease YhcR with UshA esterase domain
MKTKLHFIAFFLLILLVKTQAQADTITTDLAAKYVDKMVVLKGKVINITRRLSSKGENMLYLDLDKKYPDNAITIVIFKEALDKITLSEDELIGKMANITGTITIFKDKPNIAVRAIEQISFK